MIGRVDLGRTGGIVSARFGIRTTRIARPSWGVAQPLRTAAAVLAIAALVGLAVPLWSPASLFDRDILLAITAGLFTAAMALRPMAWMPLLLLFWAPLLFLMKDIEVLTVWEIPVALSRLMGATVVAGLAANFLARASRGGALARLPRPVQLYLAFGLLMAAAWAYSPDRTAAATDFLRFAAGALVLATLLGHEPEPAAMRRIHAALVAGILVVAGATLSMASSDADVFTWRSYGVERVSGPMASPGATSSLCVAGVAALMPLFVGAEAWGKRFLLGSGMALLVMAILLTWTRSSMLAVPMFIALWVYYQREPTWRRRALLWGLVVLLTCYGVFFASAEPWVLEARLWDIPFIGEVGLGQDIAGTGRLGLYKAHAGAFWDAPWRTKLFGRGLHASMSVSEAYYGHVGPHISVQGPHNSYLWLLNELGLFGFFLYGAFLIASYRFLRTAIRRTRAPYAAACLVSSLAYFVTYHLTSEMLGWNIPTFAGRLYFLALLALGYLSARQA